MRHIDLLLLLNFALCFVFPVGGDICISQCDPCVNTSIIHFIFVSDNETIREACSWNETFHNVSMCSEFEFNQTANICEVSNIYIEYHEENHTGFSAPSECVNYLRDMKFTEIPNESNIWNSEWTNWIIIYSPQIDHHDQIQNGTPLPAIISGLYSDSGVDVNEDGKYEVLAIDVGILVSVAGCYTILGYLYNFNDDIDIVWSVDGKFLDVGNNTIVLYFDGKTIMKRGINGPYRLKNLILQSGSSDANMTLCDVVLDAYVTSDYNCLDFAN